MSNLPRLSLALAVTAVVCIIASLLDDKSKQPIGAKDLLQVKWAWLPVRVPLAAVPRGTEDARSERGGAEESAEGSRWGETGSFVQALWGGAGKHVTGDYVDGRRTVPGLHTDCTPGVLGSDCSPAQEDGALSTDAENYLNRVTGGAHGSYMQKIQDGIDAGYAARDKFLEDCLRDASLCTGKGSGGDTPTWGSRAHPWAPEQGADFGQYNNDGHWQHIPMPSGVNSDGGLVSSAYYS